MEDARDSSQDEGFTQPLGGKLSKFNTNLQTHVVERAGAPGDAGESVAFLLPDLLLAALPIRRLLLLPRGGLLRRPGERRHLKAARGGGWGALGQGGGHGYL